MSEKIPVVLIREPGRSAMYLMIKESIYLGRGGTGVLLDDPQVSRQHLELIPGDDSLSVRDCGSTHGSFIDGVAIEKKTELNYDSQVRIGNVTIERLQNFETTQTFAIDESPKNKMQRTSIARVADLVQPIEAALVSTHQSDQTLTIVFSDIEDSTKLTAAAGDQKWFEILSKHNSLIRDSAKQYSGNIVKSNGDGFMLTFVSARSAVEAFIGVQKKLEALDPKDILQGIRIRVGIHIGEAIASDDGDYFGIHINTAARIADKAAGGEILVSQLVKEIIEARGDIVFDKPRDVSLKGIADSYIVHPINCGKLN